MCGINGFNFIDHDLTRAMMSKTRHRGPDASGEYHSKRWSLGFNRLAIIDLRPQGNQPMKSSDGRYVIVFNGEIYNFAEIRAELGDYHFQSKTDTEVILAAYSRWGEKCLEKFNGMFALAILDTQTEELFIARDRIGIKPLYYYWNDGKFIFSSEVKALFAHPIQREINQVALNMYFRMLYVPAPYTIWKHIFKLEPAHFMKVSGGSIIVKRYWKYSEAPIVTDRREIEMEIERLLKDSVRLELVSDRPVGVFLSGGVDSTIVTGLMNEITPHVRTFSVGYEETEEADKYNNDLNIARRTAEYFGTQHHEYKLSADDIINNLPKSIYHMDEPISNHIQAVNMLLAEAVNKEATVVLGGDGGDELFGGYERYYYLDLIDRLRKIPAPLRKNPVTNSIFGLIGARDLYTKLNHSDPVKRYLDFFAQKEDRVASFLRRPFNEPGSLENEFGRLYFRDMPDIGMTRLAMRTDVLSWLPNESLVRSDKMSMAASIEQRVPFLDHRLVEYADRIPVEYKIGRKGMKAGAVGRHYEGKIILKSAMKKYIPEFVLGQQKWGWFSPAAKWLRGPLLPLMNEVLSQNYNRGTADMFDFASLRKVLDDHISKKHYGLTTLWSVLTFQLWYRQFMDQ